MQNIEDLFGVDGAARYLQLIASNYRKPVWKLEALNDDGSVRYDLTSFLQSWNYTTSDESGVSQRATFILSNANAQFDPYGASPVADVLSLNRVLRFQKGLVDTENGNTYLLPAFWGMVMQSKPVYSVNGATIEVMVADALKNSSRQKLTSYPYLNTEANLIASDILNRFGYIPESRIALYDVSRIYPDVQFTDQYLIDCLKLIYDALLFWVRADESGSIVTAPRLGSELYGDGLLGYPDQTTEPDSELVAYALPTALIESIQETQQDWDGIFNQFRVLGEAVVSLQVLGPVQRLFGVNPSSINSRGQVKERYPFSQQPAGTSSLVASNVVIHFQYSTDHHLTDAPRSFVLSKMPWRGAYNADSNYGVSEGVYFTDGFTYTSVAANSSDDPHAPGDTNYWRILADDDGTPIVVDPAAGFVTSVGIFNEDPHLVGFVNLLSVTASDLILDIEGREYSSGGVGGIGTRHHGGFDYTFDIYGLPILSDNKAVAAYADYGVLTTPSPVELSNPFSDNTTYQATNVPFAMSVPVEVFLDSGSGPVSQGIIAADSSILTGDSNYGVDWERGRIIFKARTFAIWQPLVPPLSGSGITVMGGTQLPPYGGTVRLKLPANPAPEEVYRWSLKGDTKLVFSGLTIGQGYTINLQFFDPVYDAPGQRVFSVYVQGALTIENLDIVSKAGAEFYAWQETLTGIAPDIDGSITINVTTHDPTTGQVLSGTVGEAIISGIEIVLAQGQGASPYFVYAGSDQYPPDGTTPPVVTATYGYSPIQGLYGINSQTIDDPLLATKTECQTVGQFWVNYSQWKRNPQVIPIASIPHLQPGDLVTYTNPITNVKFWSYIEQITRSGSPNSSDRDQYLGYVIYAAPAA